MGRGSLHPGSMNGRGSLSTIPSSVRAVSALSPLSVVRESHTKPDQNGVVPSTFWHIRSKLRIEQTLPTP